MKLRVPLKIAGIAGLLFLAEGNSLADVLPGPAMPDIVSRALSVPPPTPTQVLPPILREKQKAATPLGAAAQKIKFKLNGVILEGNHVYSTQQLKLVYQKDLGKTITVAELFTIVQNLTNYYRNNGYIISRAILPPQHVKNGVVIIRIIEGFIGKVNVTGCPRGAKCQVWLFGEKIKECRPLEISRMEKYLLIANEIPGTEVKAVLSPSKTVTSAADLTLVTNNKPTVGYVSYDNYGTRYIGPQQMTGNIGFNSLITSGDSTQLTITKTPKGGELTYIDLNYNMPVDDEGSRWFVGGTRTHTHPLFVLRPTQIDGLTDNYYTTLTYPLIRTRTKSATLRAGFNYLDSNVTTFDFELYTDHIRSLDLGGTYNFSDSWYGANLISGDFRQGLPILGYTSNTNPQTAKTSRPGGRGDYTKFAIQVSRLQAIRGPLSIYGLLSGQWAFNPLLASEQFTFGGSLLGRGYDIAEILGDKGLAGTLELRLDVATGTPLQNLQFYIFYDAGEIWNFKNIPGTQRKISGTVTGIGTRFYFTRTVSGNLMWTQTLTKQVAAEELIGDGRRPRVFFSVVAALD
jgi:hemolysin activation/secretion protein